MSSFVRSSVYSLANKIVNVILTFVTLVVVARILGPSGQGKYSLLVQFSRTFFYFTSLGFPIAFVFYFAKKKNERPDIIKTYFYIYVVLTILGILSGAAFIYSGQEEFFEGITIATGLLAVIGIPLWFINSYTNAIFTGLQNFSQLNLNQIVQPIFLFLAILFFYLEGILSLRDAVISYLVSLLLSAALNVYYLRKLHIFDGFLNAKFNKNIVKKSSTYALKTYAGTISEFLFYKADIYIIAYYLTKSELGHYVIAVNIVERLWMLSESISNVLFARLVNVESEEQKNFFSIYTLQGAFLVSLAGGIVLLVLSKVFVEVFFGKDYAASVVYIYMLLPGVILQAPALMAKRILGARGYPGTNAKASMLCLVLNIVLNILLIPRWEVHGAAFATSLTYIVYFFVQAHSLKSKFGIKKRDFLFIQPADISNLFLKIKSLKKN